MGERGKRQTRLWLLCFTCTRTVGTSVKYVTALKAQVLLLGEAFTVIGRERVLVCLMFTSQLRPIKDLLDPKDFALVMGFARLGGVFEGSDG